MIPRWQRRQRSLSPAGGSAERDSHPRLLQLAADHLATVLVDWEGEFDLASGDPGPQLLTKILDATGFARDRFSIYQVAGQPPELEGQALWFTQRPVAATGGLLLLPSVAAMLADPGLKRVAWQHLKSWMARQGERQG